MGEETLQFMAFVKLLVVACFAYLYGLGGISRKWQRRYVAPALLTASMYGFAAWIDTVHWVYALYGILLCISLHIGYGAEVLHEKIIKRSRYGAALACSALPVAIFNQEYPMWALHFTLCILFSVLLGVWNITKNPRYEETLIGAITCLVPLFMI